VNQLFKKSRSCAREVTRKIACAVLEALESRRLYSASITGVESTAAASYNLSQLGTSDWAHWGANGSATAFEHDASGGSQISDVLRLGAGNYGGYDAAARSVSWTGGSPVASNSADGGFLWANNGIGAGYMFNAPADTTVRTLYVYVGGYSSGTTLTARLSDGSAPDYSVALSGAGNYSDVVAITYSADSPGQTLSIYYSKSINIGGTNGSADLVAAWLTTSGTTASPTQPTTPVITAPVSAPQSAGPVGDFGSGTLPDGTAIPGPSNTGPTNSSNLQASGSIIVRTPGAVIQNLAVTGWIEVQAPNVTIKNCTVNANGNYDGIQINPGSNNCTVEDTSVTGTGPGGFAIETEANSGSKFYRLNLYNLASQAFHIGGEADIEGCWLHELGWNAAGITSNPNVAGFTGTDHVDDFFIETGSPITITDNNIDTPAFTTINGVEYSTSGSVFFVDPYSSGDVVSNMTVNSNYIDGGGYMFYLMGQGPFQITNNIMGPDEQYGMIYSSYIGGPWSWSGNTDASGDGIAAPTGLPFLQ
jgi:hypothetical protein